MYMGNRKRSLLYDNLMSVFLLFILVMLISQTALSQSNQSSLIFRGIVLNEFTKEPIPFASVYYKKEGFGVLTDSVGHFIIKRNKNLADSIIIRYVGYENFILPIAKLHDTSVNIIYLKEASLNEGVQVKTKFNKGLRWWRNVVSHKERNNPFRYDNYSYELYNKMELDINNIKKKSFDNKKMLKPFGFLLDNIDSVSEAKPFLPVFLTESLSDYYYSNDPHKVKEVIKAVSTNGIKNETLLQFMGGISQRVNVYQDYIKLIDKEFIGPLSKIGDRYYNYKGADTQFINKERFFHLFFTPKQEGTNTFTGDCWIHDKTWAIEKASITVAPTANINFVNRMTVVQEFIQLNDSVWMFSKDKTIADLSPFSKKQMSFIGRRTTTYRNVKVNQELINDILSKNNKKEEVTVNANAKNFDRTFWQNNRHEDLNGNETKVYQMIDTLKKMPLFKTYSNRLIFLVDGYKQIGKIEIGPWFKWFSSNRMEKTRIRFDIGTNQKFSEHLKLSGYLAYGIGDKRWKEKVGFSYKFNHHEDWTIAASYTNDLDNGRIRFNNNDDATMDNLFSRFIRRDGIIQKFINLESYKFSINRDWQFNISSKLFVNRSRYQTFDPLPFSKTLDSIDMKSTEIGLNFRYAPDERKIKGRRKSFTLKGKLPVVEVGYAMAFPKVFGGQYTYKKISMDINHTFRIPRWGKVDYMGYCGKVDGNNIPFTLLEIHPGNEVLYYSKQSFNLMNRFEYVSDVYGGFNIEHNFEKKLLNLIPFMRKTKMRQFWNLKTVWGDLSGNNHTFNRLEFGNYRLKTLHSKPYTEIGTGVDNIFNCFRIDLVWRFAPSPLNRTTPSPNPSPPPAPNMNAGKRNNFGIFGSFRLQF